MKDVMQGSFKAEIKKELTEHIIPFWQGLIDRQYGGFYGYMGYDLKVDKKAVKGAILNSRILWFFSSAYMLLKDEGLLKTAGHAYKFLTEHLLDKENGGVYWSAEYDGRTADSMKHSYCQSFAIYALSAYSEAAGDKEALGKAMELFDIIESRMRDKDGYLEAFTMDFKAADNEKLSENGVMAERTMNTLLHVMEAYTELYRVSSDTKVRAAVEEILSIFAYKVYDPDKKRLKVFFDKDYRELIDLYSYGHDIEAAWLIDRAELVIGGSRDKERVADITRALTEQVYISAFKLNSLPAECENGVDKEKRVWWVQAEAVNGFLNGYINTGDKKYLEAAESVWNFIHDNMVDSRKGSEWYAGVDKDGKPEKDEPIVEPWKCPYHNGRMCLEVLNDT